MSTEDSSSSSKPSRDSDCQSDRLADVIPDASLRSLIDDDPDHVCSLIVEADLPKRSFTVSRRPNKRTISESQPKSSSDRESVLAQLADELRAIVGDKNMKVLKSAGAVVIQVPANKLKKVCRVANVRAIRPNRKLPPIKRIRVR